MMDEVKTQSLGCVIWLKTRPDYANSVVGSIDLVVSVLDLTSRRNRD